MSKLKKLQQFALENKAVIAVTTVAIATVALVVIDLAQKDDREPIDAYIVIPEN